MKNMDINNMSDKEFMRFVKNDKSIVRIEQLNVGDKVLIKDLHQYVIDSDLHWNLEDNGFSCILDGTIYFLPNQMLMSSNKELEVYGFNLSDRVRLSNGFSYLLDMIEINN